MDRTRLGTKNISSFFGGAATPQAQRGQTRPREPAPTAPEPQSQKKLKATTPERKAAPRTRPKTVEILEISDDEIEEEEGAPVFEEKTVVEEVADLVRTPAPASHASEAAVDLDEVMVLAAPEVPPVRINMKDEDEDAVAIPPKLAKHLKPHQLEGVRFCYERLVQSLAKLEKGGRGSGAILAHTMGLGKTLQAVTVIRTLLLDPTIQRVATPAPAGIAEGAPKKKGLYETVSAGSASAANPGDGSQLRNCIVLCPVNVLANWQAEFRRWEATEKPRTRVVSAMGFGAAACTGPRECLAVEVLDGSRYKTVPERVAVLRRWSRRQGAVLIMGYDMMRRLVEHKNVRRAADKTAITQMLVDPGPDILVMDEGHVLKNGNSSLAEAILKVRTRRRLVLTGTPLQNNLLEYFTMVECVKRGVLGRQRDFVEAFLNPIKAGQAKDATRTELRLMRRKAHALRKRLELIVHRRGVDVLRADLPVLRQHVLTLPPTALQERLLGPMLAECRRKKEENGVSSVLDTFQWSLRASNHPSVLTLATDGAQDEDVATDARAPSDAHTKAPREQAADERLLEKQRWKRVLGSVPREEREAVDQSLKMRALLSVLRNAHAQNERVLVFSQSLLTLDYIERMLLRGSLKWYKQLHYARIDGATPFQERQGICNRFNRRSGGVAQTSLRSDGPTGTFGCEQAGLQCVLISTRAGNMGINLTGANHVVLFDCSWNPANDTQAIFRAYRYGQTRPVQVYRLVTRRSIEHRVYKRQVAKTALALRIVDDQAAGRHYNRVELEDLFGRDVDAESDSEAELESDDEAEAGEDDAGRIARKKMAALGVLPGSVLEEVLGDLEAYSVRIHEHDVLMEEQEDEKLAPTEARVAENVDTGAWIRAAALGAWEAFHIAPGSCAGPEDPKRAVFFHEETQTLTQDPPGRVAQAFKSHRVALEDAERRQAVMAQSFAPQGAGKPIPPGHYAKIAALPPQVRAQVLQKLMGMGYRMA